MRNLGVASLGWLITAVVSLHPAFAQSPQTLRHGWNYIDYPPLPATASGSPPPSVLIYNREDDGMLLSLSYFVSAKLKEPPKEVPPLEEIVVRLHTGGGVSEPALDRPRMPGGFSLSGVTTYSYTYPFNWNANALEEAWIEVRLPEQTYWVELPYGFTRDPTEPLQPAEARRGPPAFPATMKPGDTDRLVPWRHVHYDLGTIQNGWRMSVKMANPFDAEAEVVLYREDSEARKTIYLWDLHTPLTSMALRRPDGSLLHSTQMIIRRHEDGMRRSDHFKLSRNPEDERQWGTAIVTVDDRRYEWVVPSSLFNYVHGTVQAHRR